MADGLNMAKDLLADNDAARRLRFLTTSSGLVAWSRTLLDDRSAIARVVLFLYIVLVACPLRYWPLRDGIDETWRFVLNYAPNHGYTFGRDIVYNCGPLTYLMMPENIGNNLALGLAFQALLWLILAAIFADLFFRGGFRIWNLVLFSICFGLAAPLFWFNSFGPENLIVSGILLLIIMFQLHGGWARYTAALLLIGALPMFKLSAALIAGAALAGFLVTRVIDRKVEAWREVLMAAVIPLGLATILGLWLLPSLPALVNYVRGSLEVVAGYTAGMSGAGPRIELVFAAIAAVVLAIAVWLQTATDRKAAKFFALLLAGPTLVSLKHGFVRQDNHVISYFCFVALALGLVSLRVDLRERRVGWMVALLGIFGIIWQQTILMPDVREVVVESTGMRMTRMLGRAVRFQYLKRWLDSFFPLFPESSRLEPELTAIVGNSSVASLSSNFMNVAVTDLRLTLYPSVQRFVGFTPLLDRWNAGWVQDKGPRFLIFDGQSIDGRDPWVETPAMLLEIYRWYETRYLGPRNLLLERRMKPRFGGLETIGRSRVRVLDGIEIPSSSGPIFWTMECDYSPSGVIKKLFARSDIVTMSVHEKGGVTRNPQRVIPDLFVSPVLGNYLPKNLEQFAAIFQSDTNPTYSVDRIYFGGAGVSAYASVCETELLRPVR